MTKKAVIELIIKRCKDIDSTGQFNPLYVESFCDNVWQEFIIAMNSSKEVDFTFYSKMYPAVSVTYDTTTKYYYSELPETIINIPSIGSGIASIRQVNSFDAYFIPVSETDFSLLFSQEAYRIGGDIYYFTTYDTVYFSDSMTSDIAASGVDMRLIIPFSKYNLDEEVPLPSLKDTLFIDAVVQRIIGTPPTNTTNKNSDQ
jgi:hypothetical protein